MTKPVQRWDAPRGTTLAENNESGELVMHDDHLVVVHDLCTRLAEAENAFYFQEAKANRYMRAFQHVCDTEGVDAEKNLSYFPE